MLSLALKYTRNKSYGAWSLPVWDSGKTVKWLRDSTEEKWLLAMLLKMMGVNIRKRVISKNLNTLIKALLSVGKWPGKQFKTLLSDASLLQQNL